MRNFKAGVYKQQYQYKSFSPSSVNRNFEWQDKKINILIAQAMQSLGELKVYSSLIPDVDFFIKMHVVKEAVKSSTIEGTKTKVEEAVLPKEEIILERRDDWAEVQNYVKAINFTVARLKKIPLSFRLIKEAHKILLSGVRGKHKMPGDIRQSQNWIGGSSLTDAFFIPPHHEEVPELLADLEKFWHNKNLKNPALVNIAISHYQFETIHPFLDGNGRIGRLLIMLQLISSGILDKPALPLSSFFEKNRASYYDSLTMARKNNDLEQWTKFFLNGIIESADDSVKTFKLIVDLRRKYEARIMTLGSRAKKAQKLLLFMFSNPIMSNKRIMKEMKTSFNSANRLVKSMVDLKLLKEVTGLSRNRMFELKEYLDLFRK